MSDRLAKLKQLEVVTLESINDAASDKRAPLIAQLRQILAEIDELAKDSGKVSDPLDEIAARRAARGVAAAGKGRASV